MHFHGFFKLDFKGKEVFMFSIPTIIENELFWNGIENCNHEPMTYLIWHFLSAPSNQIIYDIGSNTGVFSCISFVANENNIVHSFDPSSEFLYAQYKNREKNKMPLVINKCAVGDEYKKVAFNGYEVVGESEDDKPDCVLVEMIKLSDYIGNNRNKVDLIKIDTEGCEYKILKDILPILKREKPNLIVEVLTDEEAERLNELIEGLNYHYFLVDDYKNKIIKSEKIRRPPKYNVAFINEAWAQKFEEEFKGYIVD